MTTTNDIAKKYVYGRHDALTDKQEVIDMSFDIQTHAINFAEWINIHGYRDGEHEWKYKGDNYKKKHSTTQMFFEWQLVVANENKTK